MPTSDASGPGQEPTLHVHQQGHGRRLVLAHGFTQTATVWGGIDDALATGRTVIAVDLPGHGSSADVRADLPTGATLLGAAGGCGDYLGYSMGARFCLHLALARPDLVSRLVLISGTAGIEDAGERAVRRTADIALADRIDPVDGAPEDTLPEFVTRWVANPMFGTVPRAAQGLEERLSNSPSGLASSLRLAGTGTQEPLWAQLGGLTMPVLVVSGAGDAKFTELGRRLVRSIGTNATHVVIDDADHAPHLQHPGEVTAAVRAFLDVPFQV
ncbi:MAG: alpha/beta fold hydrolase [Acidimicrobiales bacterium]